jgi:hypothetical protein
MRGDWVVLNCFETRVGFDSPSTVFDRAVCRVFVGPADGRSVGWLVDPLSDLLEVVLGDYVACC